MTRFRVQRAVSVILLCVLIFSWTSMTMAYADAEGHWAAETIERWRGEYRVLDDTQDSFRPNADITRAETAVLLDRTLGFRETEECVFRDLNGDEWYFGAVCRACAAGVLLGDGEYANPRGSLTREQAAVMMARAFSIDVSLASEEASRYEDRDEISDWAVGAVGAMTELGYMQGYEGRFRPKDRLTRAEALTVLDNIVRFLCTEGGNYRKEIDGSMVVHAQDPVLLYDTTIRGDLIIAHDMTLPVLLDKVTVEGKIVNYSFAEPVIIAAAEDETEYPEAGEIREIDEIETISYEHYVVPVLDSVPRCSFDASLFRPDADGRMQYASPDVRTWTGVDVSAWQEDIDWALAAADGIDFAMLRVGYRGYTEGTLCEDAYFKKNIRGALSAGLDVGVYFFSQAVTVEEALEEARFVLDLIEGYPIAYPVVFDWEPVTVSGARSRGLSTETLCAEANAFCREIAAAGYRPMIYFNHYAGYIKYDLSEMTDYDFWLAQYADAPSFYYDFDMWQYTADGSVAGIPGGVDMNLCFRDYASR